MVELIGFVGSLCGPNPRVSLNHAVIPYASTLEHFLSDLIR